ncbi:MAG: hypothetical protein AB7E09_00265 [Candidatus Izemoplasmatales bacterium]|uniref:Uncharacterized protein n=1 Tax=Hujiaoplasma nucleasis TaxID=2725268 RepID=A0A7L6N690_9MOLU|nr:hypothetical protein [Hujiaoplasma nucleasis]QLY40515.1 hypothetical protein HF295_06480 [Hujiaoplasma nucleasis]
MIQNECCLIDTFEKLQVLHKSIHLNTIKYIHEVYYKKHKLVNRLNHKGGSGDEK